MAVVLAAAAFQEEEAELRRVARVKPVCQLVDEALTALVVLFQAVVEAVSGMV